MNKWIKIVIYVVVLVIVGYLGYIFAQRGQAPEQAMEKKDGIIKIGVSGPFTGEAASYGDGMKGGATLAAKEINDAGGINGAKLELIYEDDTCNSKNSPSAMNKLVNIDKVVAVVGPVCSAAAGAALPIAQEAGTPVNVFGSAPHLTAVGDYVFRIYPSDSFQGKFVAEYVFNKMGGKKVAVLYTKNDWGQGMNDVFTKTFKELGGEIVFDEGVAQDTKDLRSFVSKIKAAKPDVLFIPMYPAGGVIALKNIQDAGLKIPIIGGDAFDTDEVVKSGVAEGVLYSIAVISNPDEFKAKVEASGGVVNLVTPLTYDAVKIFAKIISEVGTDKAAIRDAMAKLSYAGVSSPLIEFDEQGDIKAGAFEIRVVKSSQSVKYEK